MDGFPILEWTEQDFGVRYVAAQACDFSDLKFRFSDQRPQVLGEFPTRRRKIVWCKRYSRPPMVVVIGAKTPGDESLNLVRSREGSTLLAMALTLSAQNFFGATKFVKTALVDVLRR